MTSFSSLLSSISGQPQAPQPRPTTTSKPSGASAGAQALSNGARPQTSNAAAGVKRKPEDQAAAPKSKVVKTEVSVPVRPPGQSSTAKAAPPAPAGEYRGTARGPGATTSSARPIAKPVPKLSTATTATASASTTQSPAVPNAAPKKRGFASLMEKAKAAQEAAKAVGSSTIKHKPVERLSKRERAKLAEEAAKQQKAGGKAGKLVANDRSRSGTPVDAKGGLKKAPEPTYKGTMKKGVERQEFAYKGTARKAEPGAPKAKTAATKARESKYNGYVSWSDLDDAEDDEEEGYDSESDMDAGFDDMESEEKMALAAARKEDQEALEEEERHKREKLERKRKLQALSKSAAARKKF
ncbi:hypothetical protein M409DRAFT_16912 [Zasmidium cellare ATCC 36951]|uniref:SPT2 chromatin protein n=1 Tax=Zasmidium cellare ATCC 36951 TaxID=1080233 RepID=A0A6A6D0S5_ZASCE|nr:uncharacterized protein M409DRAFT_16912 [Zasmidium cellare ATCC 36951]KAF2172961.1 hypothetical protein M409DRAFT_16912 [Zasmidium cellare ATCC 36951]